MMCPERLLRALPLALLLLVQPARASHGSEASSPAAFSHGQHVEELELGCDSCHPDSAQSRRATQSHLPLVAACLDCHEADDSACPVCDLAPDRRVPARHQALPLFFSHRNHMARGAGCDDCHDVTEASAEHGLLPPMDTCLACHDESPCSRCHVQLDTAEFRPLSHDAFWREKHGRVTRRELGQCADCHRRPGWCQECHQGDIQSRYHDVTFRMTHGLEVRLSPARCQTCHTTNFCQNCHSALGR